MRRRTPPRWTNVSSASTPSTASHASTRRSRAARINRRPCSNARRRRRCGALPRVQLLDAGEPAPDVREVAEREARRDREREGRCNRVVRERQTILRDPVIVRETCFEDGRRLREELLPARELRSFLCSEALRPDGAALKEVTIGNALYQRHPPYDPRIDSSVRVEVRRLRMKLRAYYAGGGAKDLIRIELPVGRYTPTFSFTYPPLHD